MSGFEVVGVVLAVIPLFVSAVEHHQQGRGVIYRTFNKSRVLQKLSTELKHQITLLQLILQALVSSTTLSPTDQAALVDDPLHPLWQASNVLLELERGLGAAKSSFFDNLDNLIVSLLRIIKRDDLIHTGAASMINKLEELKLKDLSATGNREVLWDRIKISWKDPMKNPNLLDIQHCNKTLERLMRAVEGTKGFRETQDLQHVHREYEVREQAQNVFDALLCQCECQVAHEPKLCTRPRLKPGGLKQNMKFEILLLQPNHACHEMSVAVLQGEDWVSGNSMVQVKIDSHTKTSRGGTENLRYRDQRRSLRQICEAVEKAKRGNLKMHLAIDHEKKLWEIDTSPQIFSCSMTRLLSLEECLKEVQDCARKRWLHREKAILSAILAHSLLQLGESAWLNAHWSTSSIVFVDNSTARSGIKLSRPYFSTTESMTHMETRSWGNHKNPCLLAFGKVLIELYKNKSVSEEISSASSGELRVVLGDLLEDCYENDDMSDEYYNAVRFCLSPIPDRYSRKYTFDDPGFREKYYGEVIVPLEAYLKTKVAEFDDAFWGTL